MSPVGSALGVGWCAELDGAVYGQPLVIGNQVIAATENDTVYALSARDGQVAWSFVGSADGLDCLSLTAVMNPAAHRRTELCPSAAML